MIRFGKTSGPLLLIKSDFFTQNKTRLEQAQKWAQLYRSQPPRTKCINCSNELGLADFFKLGVGYAFCSNCGHLNGLHEDTDEFCNAIYMDDSGREYAKTYLSTDKKAYRDRVKTIYLPKVKFLSKTLKEQNENPTAFGYADIGAGSGYMLAALEAAGFRATKGYEVSKSQVEFGNRMLGSNLIQQHEPGELDNIIKGLEVDILCMIGTLEHLQNPQRILKAIINNRHLKYLYISVPMMSPCVYLEMVFPGVMPRHLTGGHTHLYTNSSLAYICRTYGLEFIGEWWFGTDMVDLYRDVLVTLESREETKGAVAAWRDMFMPLIDDMQKAMDQHKSGSEVHLVLKVKR
jgi:hypothetical protein